MGLLLSKLSVYFDRFSSKSIRILVLGLEGGGKTTMMYTLARNEKVTTRSPAVGFNVMTIRLKKGITFTAWNVNARIRDHALSNHYFHDTQGLIYVIDSNDRERFAEAYDELQGILEAPEMVGVPVVVLANKQDLPNAASCSQVAEAMNLNKLANRKWHIEGTMGYNGRGLYEALEVLSTLIEEFNGSQSTS